MSHVTEESVVCGVLESDGRSRRRLSGVFCPCRCVVAVKRENQINSSFGLI